MRSWTMVVPVGAVLLAALGCAHPQPQTQPADYQTVAKDPRRDTAAARDQMQEGVKLLEEGKLDAAQAKLKKALTLDPMFGPAHNELGRVYFRQNQFYTAAWEFQYAAKLLPTRPEPHNNLGLVLESAGKIDDAIAAYEKALSLAPDNSEVAGNLARAHLRRGDRTPQVRKLLELVAVKDQRPTWSKWAREQLALLPRQSTTPEPEPLPEPEPQTQPATQPTTLPASAT